MGAVTAFFARRSRDPQLVADLSADTFVEAIRSFGSSPPARGSERAWLFAIARRVYAKHCARTTRRQDAARRDSGRQVLDEDATEQLADRIDAERPGRELLEAPAQLLHMGPRPSADHRRSWRAPLAGGGIALTGAIVAAALTVTAGTSPPAYALQVNTNGSVTLTINELIGINGANAQLAKLGVRARVAKLEAHCTARGHFIRVPLDPPLDRSRWNPSCCAAVADLSVACAWSSTQARSRRGTPCC